MDCTRALSFAFAMWPGLYCAAAELRISDDEPLALPQVGANQLRVLAPRLLELTLVTTKKPDPARVEQWDFVSDNGQARLPEIKEFLVSVGNKTIPVTAVGF